MKNFFNLFICVLLLFGTCQVGFSEEVSILYNASVVVHATAHGSVWFVAEDNKGRRYNFWTPRTERSDKMIFEAYTKRNSPNKFDIYFYKNRTGYLGNVTYSYVNKLGYGGHRYYLDR